MITRQIASHISIATIKAQVRISFEQGSVIQRRHVLVAVARQALTGAMGGDDGIDIDAASPTIRRVMTTEYGIEKRATVVRYLLVVIKTHRIAVVDPLKRHSSNIGS